MSNFSTAIGATETALSSAGSAFVENERYMDSIEGKLSQLDSTWQLFSQQTIGSEFVKNMIEGATAFLQLSMSIGGLPTILMGVATAFALYRAATMKATTATVAFGLTAKGMMGVIGLIGAAVTVGISLWNNYKNSQEDARQATLDSIDVYDEEISALADVKGAIKEASSREELISAIGGVNEAYATELQGISDLNAMRERGIELIDAEAKAKADEWLRTNKLQVDQAQRDMQEKGSSNVLIDPGDLAGLDSFISQVGDTRFLEFGGTLTEQYTKMGEWLDQANQMPSAWREMNASTMSEVADKYIAVGDAIDENNAIMAQSREMQEISYKSIEGQSQILDEYQSRIEASTEAQTGFATATEMANNAMSSLNEDGTINLDFFKDFEGNIDNVSLALLEEEGALIATANGYQLNAVRLAELSSTSANMNTILNNLSAGLISEAEAATLLSQELSTTSQAAVNASDTLSTIETPELDVEVNTDEVTSATGTIQAETQSQTSAIQTTEGAFRNFSTSTGSSMSSSSASVSGFSGSLASSTGTMQSTLSSWLASVMSFATNWNNTMNSLATAPTMSSSAPAMATGTPCYADGTTGHNAVIDEHNKTEIVARNLGGRAVHLERGDAVLPNPTSVNLMNFGKNPAGFINSLVGGVATNQSDTNGVNVGNINITLPSVTDSQSFANEITKTFKAISKQYSHSRT